jgi:hypothetical protein
MYELIAGNHPLWDRKKEDKKSYKLKTLNFQKMEYKSSRFNELSKGLIDKLCSPKPSLRYTVD